MKRFLATVAAGLSALFVSTAVANPVGQPAEPERMLPSDLEYAYVRLNTNKGPILIELNNKQAPISASNFVMYVEDGHYNGTIFHRVMSNFMIQGGGFDVQMNQKDTRTPIRNEWRNGLKNMRGTIAMARLGNRPDSATAQFFVNVTDNAFLDQPRDGAGYAVFGKVIDGMEVVDEIRGVPTGTVTRSIEQVDPATGETTAIDVPMQNVPNDPVIIENAERVDPDSISGVIAEVRAAEEAEQKAAEERRARLSSMDAGLEWLVENKGVDANSVVKHESGLWSVVASEGDGSRTPEATERVTVHYTGWLTDGTKFDSSRDRGQPATFGLNQVIGGWTEGVGYMTPGETRFLIIPADLGYGMRGSPPVIPGGAVLIFDVELIEIPG